MSRLDKFHAHVKEAIEKDGWTITHDPYILRLQGELNTKNYAMDNLKQYQSIIEEILEETATYYRGTTNPLSLQSIIDQTKHHFQLLMFGWDNNAYFYQCLYHLELRGDKVWIHWNTTDIAVEDELLAKGIAAEDIVLGMKHPDYRQFTNFAVA